MAPQVVESVRNVEYPLNSGIQCKVLGGIGIHAGMFAEKKLEKKPEKKAQKEADQEPIDSSISLV